MSGRVDRSRLRTLQVLHEDDALVAVAKPPGMSVHGGAGESGPTVIDLLRAASPDDLQLAHRIDRATSGLLLLAKGAAVTRALGAAWASVEKRYLAVALGELAGRRRYEAPLAGKDGRMEDARTDVEPLASLAAVEPRCTLVSVRIETGRMHQIRRHLAGDRHPLLLDDKHGDFAASKAWSKAVRDAGGPRPKHLMLHAWRVRLRHPTTGEALELTAPVPASWPELLRVAGAGVDALAALS